MSTDYSSEAWRARGPVLGGHIGTNLAQANQAGLEIWAGRGYGRSDLVSGVKFQSRHVQGQEWGGAGPWGLQLGR